MAEKVKLSIEDIPGFVIGKVDDSEGDTALWLSKKELFTEKSF